MSEQGLVGSRAVVERRYAILPPEGIPESVLPEWTQTAARILAAPAMGAAFAEYRLDVAKGGGSRQTLAPEIEAFFYVLSGEVSLHADGGPHPLTPGGFAYLPPGSGFALRATTDASVLWLKKRYEPFGDRPPESRFGNEADVVGAPFMDIPELLLKHLIPDEPRYDLAMNIFTFPPGYMLPMTETHVMEHGLVFLQGKGVYFLGDRWHEVKEGDFIWMGPYCPQSFVAGGTEPSRYLYYKNVNRDVAL